MSAIAVCVEEIFMFPDDVGEISGNLVDVQMLSWFPGDKEELSRLPDNVLGIPEEEIFANPKHTASVSGTCVYVEEIWGDVEQIQNILDDVQESQRHLDIVAGFEESFGIPRDAEDFPGAVADGKNISRVPNEDMSSLRTHQRCWGVSNYMKGIP